MLARPNFDKELNGSGDNNIIGERKLMINDDEKSGRESLSSSKEKEKDSSENSKPARSPSKDDDYYDRDSDNSDKENSAGLQVDESSTRDSDVATPSSDAETHKPTPTTTTTTTRSPPTAEETPEKSFDGDKDKFSSSTTNGEEPKNAEGYDSQEERTTSAKRGNGRELSEPDHASKRQKRTHNEEEGNEDDNEKELAVDDTAHEEAEVSSPPRSPSGKSRTRLKTSSEHRRESKRK